MDIIEEILLSDDIRSRGLTSFGNVAFNLGDTVLKQLND